MFESPRAYHLFNDLANFNRFGELVCDVTLRKLAYLPGHEGFHGGTAGGESRVGVMAGHWWINMARTFPNDSRARAG